MERLCNMLNDLSSITRLEEGGKDLMREKVDFHELLANVDSELSNIKSTTSLQFTYNVPPQCNVVGNYNLLFGMVTNLIRNSNFHSGGTMCCLALIGQNDREYRFTFYDDGKGVEEEHLPHLFERF